MELKRQNKLTSKQLSANLKNKIRGSYSILDTRLPSKVEGDQLKQRRKASAAIVDALAAARKELAANDLQEFEKWAEDQGKLRGGPEKLGREKFFLGLAPKLIGNVELSDVLVSAIDRLTKSNADFIRFFESLDRINKKIEMAEFDSADEILDAVVFENGYSFWAIEAKIAIYSSAGRFVKAKELISSLSAGTIGLNAFYLYHFGLRNEASQSTSRFNALITKRLSDSTLSEEYKTYAAYRVARVVPADSSKLAEILTYESYTTLIDIFFTATRIAFAILSDKEEFSVKEVELAVKLLQQNSPFSKYLNECGNDLRLNRELEVSVNMASSMSLGIEQKSQVDISSSIYSKGLAAMLSYSGSEADEERLKKRIQSYWWMPEAVLVDSAGVIPRHPDIYAKNWQQNTAKQHPLLIGILKSFSGLVASSGLESFAIDPGSDQNSPPWNASAHTSGVADCLYVDACWQSYRDDDHQRSLRLMQFALNHNSRLLQSLPIKLMFDGTKFDRIRNYGISVDLCNCLHWYTTINNERQNRTFKRFAIEEWIESINAAGIVDAADKLIESDLHVVLKEFFLASSCDLATIELLIEVDGTRDALGIRAQLLEYAAKTGRNSIAHVEESREIREQLDVEEVLEEIDETMVYVDEEALLPMISREMAADFERYKTLTSRGSSVRSSIDELLKNLKQQSPSTFQIPKSEADDLLLQMIQLCLDSFVEDTAYGLDAIIGRRIRHGTISSELRGTLEQLHLIGQRPRSGADYELPNAVAQFIKPLNANVRRGVSKAFSRFSQAIDNLVAQLRDESFQCKEKGRLKPAFSLTPGVVMFAFAADSANKALTVEEFTKDLFSTFWVILSTSVEKERLDVKSFAEQCVSDACGKLAQDLKASGMSDLSFLSSIRGASEELQRRAEVIGNWIRIPKVSIEGRRYPLHLVFDAAMAFTKSKKAAFEPQSIEEIDDKIYLDVHLYRVVFDSLCIALGNIAEHSGIKRNQKINTVVGVEDSPLRLTFKITSEMSKDSWTKDRSSRLDAIREDIKTRSHVDRAKRTSGSGISKLATIVHSQENCSLEFGPDRSNMQFSLYFEIGVPETEDDLQSSLISEVEEAS